MQNFTKGFEKKAWMSVDDLEAAQGDRLIPKELVPYAEQKLQQEKSKSFALRHPWLTGIPTLGIWPSAAHGAASQRVLKDIYRNNPEYHGKIVDEQRRELEAERAHEIAMQNYLIAEREAQAREHGHAALAGAAIAGMAEIGKHLADKRQNSTDRATGNPDRTDYAYST